MFPKNSANLSKDHFEVGNDVSGHFASMLLIINAESIASKEFCQSIKVCHFEVANDASWRFRPVGIHTAHLSIS